MRNRFGNQSWGWGAVLLALAVVLNAAFLTAGPCEEAFFKCVDDPFLSGFVKTVFCVNGYIFCKKYLGS